jgi:hypothetical protein
VSQISPPLRIVLVLSISFLAVWTMFLRPGARTETPAPVPTQTQPANVAPTTPAANSATQSAAGAQAPAASAGKPDRAALAKLPDDVARAVRRDKVITLLFWNPRAADDRQVRRSIRHLKVDESRVTVKVADIKHISRYAAITRGVDVQQTPTVVVVDRKLQAESLVGYVDGATIRQAISDARRAG